MKALLLFLLALQFVTAASAQQSGVLLAIADPITTHEDYDDFSKIHPPTYSTLWIALDASGALKVLATLPELIVPRKDGFWHVGVSQSCAVDDSNKDFPPNETLLQEVWAAPIGKTSPIGQSQPCPLHKPEDYAPPYGRSEEDKNKISQCGFTLADVHYLSPEVIGISLEEGDSEACEAGRGGRITKKYSMRHFDYRSLGFGELGPAAYEAYFAALPKQGTNSFGSECGAPFKKDDMGWRVEHKNGSWRPYVNQSLGYFECAVDGPIHFQLPFSLTGDVATLLDWKLLRSKISNISDAYASPNGDLLIAITKSEMYFFEARRSVPGKLLLKLPVAEIVMAQWATGTHVQDWTTELSKLAHQH